MYSRTWQLNLLPNFFEPVFYLVGLGLGVGFYIDQINGIPYAQFLAPGLIAIAAMNGASFESTYNVYVRMNIARTYDGILATPVSDRELVMGELLWSITRAAIYGTGFYCITLLFGLLPSAWSPLLFGVVLLTGYLFSAIGQAYAHTIPTIDLFSFYFTLFYTPLFIFSDTFFPIRDRLSETWQWLPEITPLYHCVRLMRACASGEFAAILIWDVMYILAMAIGFHIIALRKFRHRIHHPAQ
jgi:lipooligosaccharide transport system permease protein